MSTSEFIKEAKRRGIQLDLPGLRELYRTGILAPFLELMRRRVSEPIEMLPDSSGFSTRTVMLQRAAAQGKIRDPGAAPYRRHTSFDKPRNAPWHWDNGLLYSRYQVLIFSPIETLWTHRKVKLRSGRAVARLPEAHPPLLKTAHRLRNLAIILTALEARYLPTLEPDWIRIQASKVEDWEQYRKSFNPAEFAELFNYSPDLARADAEQLLITAESIDPLGRDWGSLARRAPERARNKLSGAALRGHLDQVSSGVSVLG